MVSFDNDDHSYLTWLTSKEAQKLLKITGCELMHLRVSGKLTFKKKGNAYYYQIEQSNSNKTSK